VVNDEPGIAAILAVLDLTGLVGIFVLDKYQQRQQLSAKQNT
jgi:hypothetical protein